jgi:SAM-dependent methyltransferase
MMGESVRPLSPAQTAAVQLLDALARQGYRFVTTTPESHRRVLARASMAVARDLRGVFGWNLPFDEAVLPPPLFGLMGQADLLDRSGDFWKSKVRVSTVRERLFLHSGYPTEANDSVFLGPDTIRFADFLAGEIQPCEAACRLVDVGTGSGAGGIIASLLLGNAQVELVDINPRALEHARINAAHNRIEVSAYRSDGVESVAPGFDVAIANPPFIFEDDAPAYRNGGGNHGTELSFEWAAAAAAKLAPGGRLLLYTGSPIIDGKDGLRGRLERELPPRGFEIRYRELDPDIFGEELASPGYAEVERLAAVAAVIVRPAQRG